MKALMFTLASAVLCRLVTPQLAAEPPNPGAARDEKNIAVAVLGAVAKPDIYRIEKKCSLLTVISAAGGWTKLASRNKARLLRGKVGEKTDILEFNIDSIVDGKAPNPEMLDGDIVFLPERHVPPEQLLQ